MRAGQPISLIAIATGYLLAIHSAIAQADGLYSWRDEYGANHLTQELPPTSCKSSDCNRLHQQHQAQLDADARQRRDEAARKREEELDAIAKQIAEEKRQRALAEQKAMQQYYEPGAQKNMPLGDGQIKCYGKGILWVNSEGIFGINGTGRGIARHQGWKDGTQYFSPQTIQQLISDGRGQCGI